MKVLSCVVFVSALCFSVLTSTTTGNPCSPDSLPMELTGNSGELTSDNYPQAYAHFSDCQWRITAVDAHGIVALEFTDFETEACCDFLTIYDGIDTGAPELGRLKGANLPGPYQSTQRYMYLRFTTDFSVTGRGFRATFRSISPTMPPVPCSFDPQAACDRCKFDRDFVEYVGNACNCSEYYSCEKVKGVIVYHQQVCSPCTCFSDDTWGCTLPGPGVCPKEHQTEIIDQFPGGFCNRFGNLAKAGTGTFLQEYQQVRDSTPENLWTKYYLNTGGLHLMMPCPPGTYFDLPECKCLACDANTLHCAGADSNVFCFNFDGLGGEKGIYYNQAPSCQVSGNALQLDGLSCNLEVPFFKNNEFSQFTFCADYFRPAWSGAGEQGIIFNGGAPGDDCNPGSIRVISVNPTDIEAAIITDVNEYKVSGSASASQWHKVCLRYDGSQLQLAIDNVIVDTNTNAKGTTLRNNCNLLVGQSWDPSSIANYFGGSLSKVCFYNTAITPFP